MHRCGAASCTDMVQPHATVWRSLMQRCGAAPCAGVGFQRALSQGIFFEPSLAATASSTALGHLTDNKRGVHHGGAGRNG